MRIDAEIRLDFKDVLIRPKRSNMESRQDTSLIREYSFLHSLKHTKTFGVIAANMDSVGTISMANAMSDHSMMTAIHKHFTAESLIEIYDKNRNVAMNSIFYTLGIGEKDLEKYNYVIGKLSEFDLNFHMPYVCIDVANGYTQKFVDFVKEFRDNNPRTTIMAGNVVTGEITEELIRAGVDIVKVGIGPGSVCTTRRIAGVGFPQLSAIIECADAAHGLKGYICGDGGCTSPGDVAKAFAAGADFVMVGGLLAGHTECEGSIIKEEGKEEYMEFYGMASDKAMQKWNGGIAEYRASEGKTVKIPYRGSVHDTLRQIEGGVRSACLYTGSRSIKELCKRTTFIRVTQQTNDIFGNN